MDEYFWCHVLWGADEAKSLDLIFDHLFTGAHVDQLQISISANHDILWLEIPIDDAFLVEGFEDMNEKGHIESSLFEG